MTLDLTDLERLPGAADQNFEALTRAIVTRRFGALGTLRERRNQPGVEFYLRVEHHGELGEPGRVWGWSCKWFMLNARNELTTGQHGQRGQIESSLAKAIKHVEGLTDFVLCLPQRPTKEDEKWIDGLGQPHGISTKLWAAENFEVELAGFDELRSTFFGELVLTPAKLAQGHERSVAPIRLRWVPPLHTSNQVERQIERALLRPASFDWLDESITALAGRTATLRDALPEIGDDATKAGAEEVADDLDQFVAYLRAIVDAGRTRRPTEVRELVADQQPPKTSRRKLRNLVADLRKRRLPAALAVTGLAAEIRDIVFWLEDLQADVQAPLIAVVAAAGKGKTHLAAQLTAPDGRPTAGVFIQGGHLRAGGNLDDLTRRISWLKADRFEDLLLALDSAGARVGARIPLIIDGLNEAEKPSEWRSLLHELVPALDGYPNVLLIVTLRKALAGRALPSTATRLDLEWHKSEVKDVVSRYFSHYLIEARGAWLPTRMFSNPLFVRMYCEAANPLRQKPVGAESLPRSLVGVFELYRDNVANRLADDPARVTVPADRIKRRLAELAREMWNRGVRRLPSDDAKAILDTSGTIWDESLLRRLEEEGVLLRDDVNGSDDTESGILFDRFAGYLIADDLLARMSNAEISERLADPTLWKALIGDDRHSLGGDVTISLIGLLPRRFPRHHLWRYAPEEQRPWALVQEFDLESEFLDDDTVDELAKLITTHRPGPPGAPNYALRFPFDRLWEVRASPEHRLNADFLDRVLRQLPLLQRDRRWTEWIRNRDKELLVDCLKQSISDWSDHPARGETDDLDALATAWLLTSTHPEVRDLATKALQRYGRPEPRRLFELASRMLDVDDSYVVERVVGAAFGSASAHQMPDPGGPFERALAGWLAELRNRYLTGGSTPTAHELLRGYIRATFEFAGALHPGAVPDGIDPFTLTFAATPPAPVMDDDDPNAEECASTFGMDFENYVIGAAIEDRGNYDSEHDDYRRARGEVLARIWDLGWRAELLGDIDHAIDEEDQYGRRPVKVERYGKKYGWIAYYELISRLADAGKCYDRGLWGGRNIAPGIDPSFPEEPPLAPIQLPEWAPPTPTDDEAWFQAGAVKVPTELWSPEEIHDVPGGWVLIEGHLEHRRDGRRVLGVFRTILLEPSDAGSAQALLNGVPYLNTANFPELPNAGDVFAGEVPWSPRFEVRFDDDDEDAYPIPTLRRDWRNTGIRIEQLAINLLTGEGSTTTALKHSYTVPSFNLAARFGLRQLLGTLDLVDHAGVRASATFRADHPWRGQLLFVRHDLVTSFAGHRRIMQVAWGERRVAVDWKSRPRWFRKAQEAHKHVWRDIRIFDEQR